uniref:AN1-type domain-containing protein n=1 Tax=Vombatus ursinus TaxID=29139 RepID=A0A4X2JPC4_VOMUR
MEFPALVEHCSEKTCKQLDFLPLNCDACDKVFCKDHVQYEQHKCSTTYKKYMQVSVRPLCHVPFPVGREEIIDVVAGQRMDKDCKYNPLHQLHLIRNKSGAFKL